MTALIVAVKGGFTEVVKELLKRNPNVNMTDKDGNTALAIAAKEGHTEIVQDLLDAGTYVNVPDRVRPTRYGTNSCCLTQTGCSKMEDMKYNENEIKFMSLPFCFSFYLFHQSGETMLIGAVRGGHVEIVRALLNKYADIDVRGQVGVISH